MMKLIIVMLLASIGVLVILTAIGADKLDRKDDEDDRR